MRLLGVELTRFRSRRAVALLLLAAAVLTAFITVTTVLGTRPVSAAERAEAEAIAAEQRNDPVFERDLEMCRENPEGFLGPDGTADQCEEAVLPQAEWYLTRQPLDLEEQRGGTGVGLVILASTLLMVIASTFAGADWASGSVSNQLLFEPRRGRVWAAKAVAVLLGAVATTTLVQGAFWLTMFLVAESRGISTGAAVESAIAWGSARGVALAGVAALGAYALTMLFRHTVGTLAVLFAYAIGGEILLGSIPVDGMGGLTLSNNVFAWVFGGHDYFDPSIVCLPTQEFCDQMAHRGMWEGGVYLAVLVAAACVLSILLFRRRDIP